MAQRVQVMLVCDLHDDETQGVARRSSFALDGRRTRSTSATSTRASCAKRFAPFVGVARAPAVGAPVTRTAVRRRAAVGGQWFRDAAASASGPAAKGYAGPERGRIPAELAEKYAAANSLSSLQRTACSPSAKAEPLRPFGR